jgi:glycosyltransferase involved in cell wall biosynthesis
MLKLSGVIITYNEEKKIEKCIQSLIPVVDEILVVDSFSTDQTKSICLKHKVNFIEQKFLGYIEQKNFALQQTKYNYIVSLDGDEVLSTKLQQSIIALKSNWSLNGYYCNRFNNFCGQWIKHSDWYPNKKLRVFDKRRGAWKGINPHDQFSLTNPVNQIGFLKGDILHWTYQTYSEFSKKTDYFSTIAAESYFKLGIKSSIFKILFRPSWAFFKAYFLRLGFLDGLNGFIICVQTFNVTFLKYIKLRELNKRNG